jgi:predicted restriction endonuclease
MRNFDDPNYKRWRKEVYKRDNFQCQWPGCTIKHRLNAHHIRTWANYPGLRFEINNGITLCYQHHKMIKGLESMYESIFSKMILDKNNDSK